MAINVLERRRSQPWVLIGAIVLGGCAVSSPAERSVAPTSPSSETPAPPPPVSVAASAVDPRLATFADPAERALRTLVVADANNTNLVPKNPSHRPELWAEAIRTLTPRCAAAGDAIAGASHRSEDRPEAVCPAVATLEAHIASRVLAGRQFDAKGAFDSVTTGDGSYREPLDCALYPAPCADRLRERYAALPGVVARLTEHNFGLTTPWDIRHAIQTAPRRAYREELAFPLADRAILKLAKAIVQLDGLHTLVATGVDTKAPEPSHEGWLRTHTVRIVVRRKGESWCRVHRQEVVSARTAADAWTAWTPTTRQDGSQDVPGAVPKTLAERDALWSTWLAAPRGANRRAALSIGDDHVKIVACK